MKRILLVAVTLAAFAANSLLCRLALGQELIDPASFTAIRLASGAGALWLVLAWRGPGSEKMGTAMRHRAGLALFVYALAFSLAYRELAASTGAFALFASAEVCMIGASVRRGQGLGWRQGSGAVLALAGLATLAWPQAGEASVGGLALMALAGVAWGLYSLWGGGAESPWRATAANFRATLPYALVALLVGLPWWKASPEGVGLAVISGAVTSGLAYGLWYGALRFLSPPQAAVCQMATPVLAAGAGIALLGEELTAALAAATALILAGIGLGGLGRSARRPVLRQDRRKAASLA